MFLRKRNSINYKYKSATGDRMNGEQLLNMDVYMLLSIINMKLRDEFYDLNTLCEDIDIEKQKLLDKLKTAGYRYNSLTNQFILL